MFGRLNFLKTLFKTPLNNIVSSSSISTLISPITSSSLIQSSRKSNISVVNKLNNGIMSQCFEIISRGMANHRHKKVIKQAKGFRGRANRCFQVALHRVQKALQYAYRDRKVKKRDFRKLWIQRINAAGRIYGFPYGSFINSLLKSDISLNRKVLADLAITEPLSFRSVIEVAQTERKL